MIATTDDIRKIRPIADNVQDMERMSVYIPEVESGIIIQTIGAHVYRRIDEQDATITPEQMNLILDGGYYTGRCGNEKYTNGLKSAISYLVYSRFIIKNPINITAFGNVFKRTEFSEKIDEATLIRESRSTEKLGNEHLRQTVDYLQTIGLFSCVVKKTSYRKKFNAI